MATDGLTFFQRQGLRRLVKEANKQPGAQLGPEDWEAYFRFDAQPSNRLMRRMLHALPSSPRCGFCGAPFAGPGARVVARLGFRPSRKNPNICATCVELAPPGGITVEAGVLFADMRGFTALSESARPEQTKELLRRFYACAEDALFPEAIIDKFMGDAVMALYLPTFVRPESEVVHAGPEDRRVIAEVMLAHARDLLSRAGYGSRFGAFIDIGIGLDYGEAFVGNIGDRTVHDFTAVGDVVNTASRLQACAGGGEIVVSDRLARHLEAPLGAAEDIVVKGKAEPVRGYRVRQPH